MMEFLVAPEQMDDPYSHFCSTPGGWSKFFSPLLPTRDDEIHRCSQTSGAFAPTSSPFPLCPSPSTRRLHSEQFHSRLISWVLQSPSFSIIHRPIFTGQLTPKSSRKCCSRTRRPRSWGLLSWNRRGTLFPWVFLSVPMLQVYWDCGPGIPFCGHCRQWNQGLSSITSLSASVAAQPCSVFSATNWGVSSAGKVSLHHSYAFPRLLSFCYLVRHYSRTVGYVALSSHSSSRCFAFLWHYLCQGGFICINLITAG